MPMAPSWHSKGIKGLIQTWFKPRILKLNQATVAIEKAPNHETLIWVSSEEETNISKLE